MKKLGFTLIELLAVMVVLAVILAISVPAITGIISNVTKNAFKADAKMVMKAINYQKMKDESFDVTSINTDTVVSILKLSNENYQSVEVTIEDNVPTIVIVGKNKWAGLIAHGTFDEIIIEDAEDYSADNTPPVITLVGDAQVGVSLNGEYVDAGATAFDNVDGDITNNIIVTNNVNTSLSGIYTVVYTVEDRAGNDATPVVRIVRVVDEDIPVITLLGENPVIIELGDVYSEAGATAMDNVDGDITNNIRFVSNVNPNVEGMYTVTYDVTDSSGNEAVQVTRTVKVIQLIHSFSYTGDPQPFIIPVTGTYQIEAWGAGTQVPPFFAEVPTTLGKGAYTKGNINLSAGTTIYIYVGQQGSTGTGSSYNGGVAGGAGATDIRTVGGTWSGTTSLRSRIMVAGGAGAIGGTNCGKSSSDECDNYGVIPPYGGNGGLTGTNAGMYYYLQSGGNVDKWWYAGSGGTQTAGGDGGYYKQCWIPDYDVVCSTGTPAPSGTFGIGGTGSSGYYGGGGGGYYGGGGGIYGDSFGSSGGGGGSSFISGHTGCDAIDSLGNHTGAPNHFSGLIFNNTSIQSGVREGNGFVTITYIP